MGSALWSIVIAFNTFWSIVIHRGDLAKLTSTIAGYCTSNESLPISSPTQQS
jgi:hypothetical protein